MADKIFDIRQYLNDKRIYKSLKGHEIDFSFQPAALIVLNAEYRQMTKDVADNFVKNQTLQKEVMDTSVKLASEGAKEESVAPLQKLMDKMEKAYQGQYELAMKARDLGMNIIMLAAQSNPNQEHITKEWLDNEISADEFGYMIDFCMKQEDKAQLKKK